MTGARKYVPLFAFCFFALIVCFGGGASRLDVLSQPLVWIFAITSGVATLWFCDWKDLVPVKALLVFLALCAILVGLQLVPLPPGIWTALSGRKFYADVAPIVGFSQPWRSISLTPDLTWAALLSLLPVGALLLALTTNQELVRRRMLPALLILMLLSGILGIAQLGSGAGGGLRYYAVTNADSAVGIFANRNHHALFLLLGIPMAVVWARLGRDSNMQPAVRLAIAGGIAFVLLALTIATRSRAGAVLSVAALILASLLMLGKREPLFVERKGAVQSPLIKWFVFAPFAAISVALAGLAFSKAESVERLFATNLAEEQRGQMLDPLFAMIKAFMPFGSGFGSFDSLYRGFEPNELLLPTYMNHAHNDLLQLMIEGGLPGALLLLVVIYWWVRRSMFVWARVDRLAATQLLGRLGSSIVVLILLASLVDYPLRTPLIACLFALGAWWLEMAARGTTITRPEPQAR